MVGRTQTGTSRSTEEFHGAPFLVARAVFYEILWELIALRGVQRSSHRCSPAPLAHRCSMQGSHGTVRVSAKCLNLCVEVDAYCVPPWYLWWLYLPKAPTRLCRSGLGITAMESPNCQPCLCRHVSMPVRPEHNRSWDPIPPVLSSGTCWCWSGLGLSTKERETVGEPESPTSLALLPGSSVHR